jgi:hypothetical protein
MQVVRAGQPQVWLDPLRGFFLEGGKRGDEFIQVITIVVLGPESEHLLPLRIIVG